MDEIPKQLNKIIAQIKDTESSLYLLTNQRTGLLNQKAALEEVIKRTAKKPEGENPDANSPPDKG